MTRRLILLRHAKSDWGSAGLPDHDRPLNPRGQEAATRIGAWLEAQEFRIDTALVSTARRAQQTWDGVAQMLTNPPPVTSLKQLYLADIQTLTQAATDATGDTMLLVAHNPGIALTAFTLSQSPSDHPDFDRYPTGAITILRFDGPIGPGAGITESFVVPRDLQGS